MMVQIVKRSFIWFTVIIIAVDLLTSCTTSYALRDVGTIKNVERINNVVASMPTSIPWEPWGGSDGWLYKYTVTFTETQRIPTTIEYIRIIYIDTKEPQWAGLRSTYGEGQREMIEIKSGESTNYSSWVRGDSAVRDWRGNAGPDLRGGTVVVIFTGRSANGRTFSGSVSSKLAWPER